MDTLTAEAQQHGARVTVANEGESRMKSIVLGPIIAAALAASAAAGEVKVIYVMALDQIDKALWHGKVYEVPNE
jgi:hypothetical protein